MLELIGCYTNWLVILLLFRREVSWMANLLLSVIINLSHTSGCTWVSLMTTVILGKVAKTFLLLITSIFIPCFGYNDMFDVLQLLRLTIGQVSLSDHLEAEQFNNHDDKTNDNARFYYSEVYQLKWKGSTSRWH